MGLVFIQTSDAALYYPMLLETSRTVRHYCQLRGIEYIQFVGLKAGNMPWKASYNRIILLKELLDRDYRGWAFYMDADSYIIDFSFDIDNYFSDKYKYAGIFAGHLNGDPINVNSGGFAVNLDHPLGRQFIADYYSAFTNIDRSELENAIFWEIEIPEDQWLLHHVLKRYVEDYGLMDQFLFEHFDRSYVNNGPFITQALRSKHDSLSHRINVVRDHVNALLGPAKEESITADRRIATFDVPHIRIGTVVGVNDTSSIYTNGERAGCLVHGPYMPLNSGRYTIQFDGELIASVAEVGCEMGFDAVFNSGVEVAAEKRVVVEVGRFSIDLPFALGADATDVEGRAFAPAGATIRIFSIKFLVPG